MRGALILLASLTLFGACSAYEEGKKFITDQCLAGGNTVEVCDCLARESAARLEPQLFDIVVLGAKREDALAAARMEDLTPEQESKFTKTIPEIRNQCKVDG
jgi:hypothetical protein